MHHEIKAGDEFIIGGRKGKTIVRMDDVWRIQWDDGRDNFLMLSLFPDIKWIEPDTLEVQLAKEIQKVVFKDFECLAWDELPEADMREFIETAKTAISFLEGKI